MNVSSRSGWWATVAMVLLSCVCPGCRETLTVISGEVTLDGKPLEIGDEARGTVVFQPANRQGPTLNGVIGRRGHYQLATGGSRSITPGVYLATVSAVEIVPATSENALPAGKRITPEKYASTPNSGLRVVVNPGENYVVLALESDAPSDEEHGERHVPKSPAQD